MGARVIYNIKQGDDLYTCLYSHWGQTTAEEDLAFAISKARPRWDDESYCARIIISQLVGENWDSELGFGLWASTEPSTDEEWYLIDLPNNTVTGKNGTQDFETFASLFAVAR